METVLVIVPCGKSKIWDKDPRQGPIQAAAAYTGTPFRLNRAYAQQFGDAWIILSAKYGFVEPTFMIPGPYEVSFKHARTNPIAPPDLALQVKRLQLHRYGVVVGLGGKEYRKVILDAFAPLGVRLEFPFAGLPIGKMMQATKRAIHDGGSASISGGSGMRTVTDLLTWTPWHPLLTSPQDLTIPKSPGLYRIRRAGRTDVDYIGQTGMRLGQRLAMLRGLYADQMPYRDPHTAAPALWALRHRTGCEFEVSVVPVTGSTPWRKGLEALAISLYRQEHGTSPTVEFGRMPIGYRPSSQNNARLVRLEKRFRGGPEPDLAHTSHAPGLPPVGRLGGDPQALDWNGHQWSDWVPLTGDLRKISVGVGLYRIRGDDPDALLYVGEGQIPARPLAHLVKLRNTDHDQGKVFAAHARFECSWVLNDQWLSHHRLELETDLIAAHMICIEDIPAAQFLG